MKKRIISLLLAAALLCTLIGSAWTEEKDKYQAFVEKYGPKYEELDWNQAAAELGGLDAIDWKALALSAGYEGEKKIKWDRLMSIVGFEVYIFEIWPEISEAEAELANEHFAEAPELVKKYCNSRIMEKYTLDALDEFLDLFINCLEPQAVNLVRERVPAFRSAPPEAFSDSTGLMLTTSKSTGVMDSGINDLMETQIGVYFAEFMTQNEDGEYVISQREDRFDMNNAIIHEMVHLFMFDYNRHGKLSPGKPVDSYHYSIPGFGEIERDAYWKMYDYYAYPFWFLEGTACLAAGKFNMERTHYIDYGLLNEDVFSSHITPEALAEAFSENAGRLNNTGYAGDNAQYSFGSVAVAWLSDLQRQADGHGPAIVRDAEGEIISVDEAALMDGFSRLLERMHLGEPLDDVIRRVSHAKYLDTEDFGSHFICGGENGTDWETAAFSAAWLNYLVRLSNEKGYMVSGSLICGLASKDADNLDWNRREQSDIYRITDKGYVESSVPEKIVGKTAGTSAYSIFTNREFASYHCSQGADGVYMKGSGAPLPFVFERTENDEKTFSCFTALEVNGSILKSGSQYNAVSGSVKAELLPAYLDTLAPGTYKLTAVFSDEKAVTVNFAVQARPGSFEAVAVPSDTFSFKVVWEGSTESSIDFTLYKADGSVYHHGFDKKAVSRTEWQYNAWFSEPAACYVIEKPVEGYKTRYENVGVYAHITDRCCDGGSIVNYRVPKTGDDANPALWLGCVLAGLTIIFIAAYVGKRKKAHCG